MLWQICFHDLGAIFSLWKLACSELFCSHFFELCDWLILKIFGIYWNLHEWKRGKWRSLCFRPVGYLNRDSSVLWVSCRCDCPQDRQCSSAQISWLGVPALIQYGRHLPFAIVLFDIKMTSIWYQFLLKFALILFFNSKLAARLDTAH